MNNAAEVEFGDDGFEDESIGQGDEKESLDDYFAARWPLRVVYQTSTYFLPQIVDLIGENGKITLRPEYQRRLRWSNVKKSALIESMLLNMPVPPIYLYENDAARYEVMDGQQRINAIREFLSNRLKLSGLRILSRLNGLKYQDCPERVLRALERASVAAIVLLMESHQEYQSVPDVKVGDLRRRVFDRLNTGGINLNPHEVRNAMNPGHLREALVRMSRLPVFTAAFGIPEYDPDDEENEKRIKNTLYASMKDCELALRFVALRDEDQIRGAMRNNLDRAMEKELSQEEADTLVEEFRERLEFLSELFENRPFRIEDPGQASSRIYAGLYDASMIALDRRWDRREAIMERAAEIRAELRRAFEDDEQHKILTGRRNTASAVRERISLVGNLLLRAGN
jgi:hypothetical protein